jgi:hypothetical protein
LRVEHILDQKIMNIGQGGAACGLSEQLYYLDYFYREKNATRKLLYVVSPPLIFSEKLPISSETFEKEVFAFDFFAGYLQSPGENKRERLFHYLRSKLNWKWLSLKPRSLDGKYDSLVRVNTKAVENGMVMAMGDTLSSDRFRYSASILEQTITLAAQHNTEVIFIIPPAVFGKWRGHGELVTLLKKFQEEHQCPWYDFSESVMEPRYYYDHHHMNTKGVEHFTRQYLNDIL